MTFTPLEPLWSLVRWLTHRLRSAEKLLRCKGFYLTWKASQAYPEIHLEYGRSGRTSGHLSLVSCIEDYSPVKNQHHEILASMPIVHRLWHITHYTKGMKYCTSATYSLSGSDFQDGSTGVERSAFPHCCQCCCTSCVSRGAQSPLPNLSPTVQHI
jgi:hypothetical protein